MRYTKTVHVSTVMLDAIGIKAAEEMALSSLRRGLLDDVKITSEPAFHWVEPEKICFKPDGWTDDEFKKYTETFLCCIVDVEIEINGI